MVWVIEDCILLFYHLCFLDFSVFFKKERNKIYYDKRVKTEWRGKTMSKIFTESKVYSLFLFFSSLIPSISPKKEEWVCKTVTARAYTEELEELQIYSKLPSPLSFTPLSKRGSPGRVSTLSFTWVSAAPSRRGTRILPDTRLVNKRTQ